MGHFASVHLFFLQYTRIVHRKWQQCACWDCPKSTVQRTCVDEHKNKESMESLGSFFAPDSTTAIANGSLPLPNRSKKRSQGVQGQKRQNLSGAAASHISKIRRASHANQCGAHVARRHNVQRRDQTKSKSSSRDHTKIARGPQMTMMMMMRHRPKYLAKRTVDVWVLLLASCWGLSCGLGLSGPPMISPPPPSSTTTTTTCGAADSSRYRSYYSSPSSSLEQGIATWLALRRETNSNIGSFADASSWKEQVGSFADVATVVSALATCVATVGGAVLATRWNDRDEKRFHREEREAEKRKIRRIQQQIRELEIAQLPCTSTQGILCLVVVVVILLLPSYIGLGCHSLL